MRPADGARVIRRERRRAWRGWARGRRLSHKAATTYGAGQRRRDWFTLVHDSRQRDAA